MTLRVKSIPVPFHRQEHGRWLAAQRQNIRSFQHRATLLTEDPPYRPAMGRKVVAFCSDDAEQGRQET